MTSHILDTLETQQTSSNLLSSNLRNERVTYVMCDCTHRKTFSYIITMQVAFRKTTHSMFLPL